MVNYIIKFSSYTEKDKKEIKTNWFRMWTHYE